MKWPFAENFLNLRPGPGWPGEPGDAVSSLNFTKQVKNRFDVKQK